jgi:hypothetical protein
MRRDIAPGSRTAENAHPAAIPDMQAARRPERRGKDEAMSSWEFPGSDPIDIVINIAAGSIAVAAEPTDATTVSIEPASSRRNAAQLAAEIQVSFSNGRLEIIQPKTVNFLRGHAGLDLTVKAPPGSRCKVETASADVACVGQLGELDAKAASGDVTAASVTGPLSVTTASGDVWLEDAGGTASVNTASGDVQLRQAAGDVTARTASGDVSIGTAASSVEVNTASGDIKIHNASAGTASTRTVSGDTQIDVPAGTGVYLDLSSLSGQISNELQETDGSGSTSLNISCRSVSGDIKIVRASA